MTNTAEIDHLRRRLRGGVHPTVRQQRPPGASDHDPAALLSDELWSELQPLGRIASDSTLSARQVSQHLDSVARVMRIERPALLATLFSPELVLERIEAHLGRHDAARTWLWMCWIAEAVWLALRGSRFDPPYAHGDEQYLLPVAARLRFLVLTEPLRHGKTLWKPDEDFGEHGFLGVVFGDNTAHDYLARCRESRWEWKACLDHYQSHAVLAGSRADDLETELDQLVFRCPPARRWGAFSAVGRPLSLSWPTREKIDARLTAADGAFIASVIERHLLPRFRLARVGKLAFDGSRWRWIGMVVVLLAGLGVVILVAIGCFLLAMWAAAVTFVLLGLGVFGFGKLWATPWLLRLPAASAVGMVVLVALAPSWWQTPALRWEAPVLLVGASFSYLIVELRNHGVHRCAAVWRAVGVIIVGCMHALLVTLLGMAVAPSYVEHAFEPTSGRYRFVDLWQITELAGEALSVLTLATAWCLAVGVFSQILWDDRPISAPLAHLQWTREKDT